MKQVILNSLTTHNVAQAIVNGDIELSDVQLKSKHYQVTTEFKHTWLTGSYVCEIQINGAGGSESHTLTYWESTGEILSFIANMIGDDNNFWELADMVTCAEYDDEQELAYS